MENASEGPEGARGENPVDGSSIDPATDGQVVPNIRPSRRGGNAEGGRGRVLMIVMLVAVAAGLSAFALVGMKDNAIYSKPVDEVLSARAQFTGKPVRVEGMLVSGTLTKRESPCEYRFEIEKNGSVLPVRYPQCVVPDTFRDVPGGKVGVTVEGVLKDDGSFEATTVLAKCPSKYEMQERAGRGEKAPHDPVSGS